MRMCYFQAQYGPFVLNKIFLVKTIIITFIYLLAFFIVQKFFKNLTEDLELWRCAIHFWAQNGPFAPNNFFFWKKSLRSFSSSYWPLSLCKVLKNFLQRIQIYEDGPFWAHNGPFAQMKTFSAKLLISLVPFIHAYLHDKNQSEILIC